MGLDAQGLQASALLAGVPPEQDAARFRALSLGPAHRGGRTEFLGDPLIHVGAASQAAMRAAHSDGYLSANGRGTFM